MLCACNSQNEYSQCCEPILNGNKAKTAEQLMRARYVAFTEANIDFIQNTLHPKAQSEFDREANKKWAEDSEWLGLEVINTEKGTETDTEGKVEFKARYKSSEGETVHHELAEFKKVKDTWYFSDAKHPSNTTVVRTEEKVGRNDPCPCGSGKKYKKCCAA